MPELQPKEEDHQARKRARLAGETVRERVDPSTQAAVLPKREAPMLPTGKLYKRPLKERYWGRSNSKIVRE